LQINERYKIFHPGNTVVDLGYAPGSWSQVAIDLVRPGQGRVIGVDIIPVQPPKGVNGIQGDFLSPEVQARVREFVQDETRGKVKRPSVGHEADIIQESTSYIDAERAATQDEGYGSDEEQLEHAEKCVDVVLSDMSEPWEITSGLWKNTISNPYRRMMNTTGNKFRDHAGSMVCL
jgi:21S rRNA (uridine2791-2'-O)-methyltransferase